MGSQAEKKSKSPVAQMILVLPIGGLIALPALLISSGHRE